MKAFTFMVLFVFALPGTALAVDECASDGDCPWGFQCTEVTLPCATMPGCVPCTCACPAEGECPPCECEPCPEPEPCQEQTVKSCTYDPIECAGDEDCEEGFGCVEVESCWGTGCACPACACAACPDGMDCPPCDCPEVMECDCNPDDFEEHCEVEGAWCMPEEKACIGDNDCPDGWECVASPVPCACEPCMCPDIACAPDSYCPDVQPCECPPCQCDDTGEKSCLPSGWYQEGYAGKESTPDSAFAELSGSNGTGTGNQNPQTPTPMDTVASSDTVSNNCHAGNRPSTGTALLFLAWLTCLWLLGRRRSSDTGLL